MQNDHRLSVLKRHRFSEFVIYSDFYRVEFVAAHRYVVSLSIDEPYEFAVLARDVAGA
jgi:hypothetical protein